MIHCVKYAVVVQTYIVGKIQHIFYVLKMVHCAVYNCGSNSSKKSEKNISFYQLPKNENGQYDENAEKW